MNMEIERHQMVQQQVRTVAVSESTVLGAMDTVKREDFVPMAFRHVAYADSDIPIGHGQYMLAPQFEGRLLQALKIGPADSVLEIGTGTGYLTACIALLAKSVTSIDLFDDLVKSASSRLSELDISNVSVQCMDMMDELPEGNFDAIVVSGSLPELDNALVEKLTVNGRMFIVLGNAPVMAATLVQRESGSGLRTASLFETLLPPLLNVRKTPAFSF